MDTLTDSYINSTLVTAGSAALEAEREKSAKYQCPENHFVFVPFGFETFGPWGPEAKEFVRVFGRKLKEETGDAHSVEF